MVIYATYEIEPPAAIVLQACYRLIDAGLKEVV